MRALSRITMASYFPSESIIHQLDPRIKIGLVFLGTISIFAIDNFLALAFLFLFLGYTLYLSEIPLSWFYKALRPIVYILELAFIFQVFWTPGRILLRWWFLKITYEGIINGAFVSLRLVLLVIFASLLTFTTTPIELTDGLESLLRPLQKLKIPAHELAMMMTIALRFIPVLFLETQKIVKAQKARGADFESGNLFRRAKALIPLFIPLFMCAYRRAEELGTAMESRCYRGGEGRTRMRQFDIKSRDWITLFTVTIILVIAIFIR